MSEFVLNLFWVALWTAIILSPVVLLVGLWKLYCWAEERRDKKRLARIKSLYAQYQANQLYYDFMVHAKRPTWDDLRYKKEPGNDTN